MRRLAFPLAETVGDHGRKHWKLDHASGLPAFGFTLDKAAALYLGRQFLEGLAGTLFWPSCGGRGNWSASCAA